MHRDARTGHPRATRVCPPVSIESGSRSATRLATKVGYHTVTATQRPDPSVRCVFSDYQTLSVHLHATALSPCAGVEQRPAGLFVSGVRTLWFRMRMSGDTVLNSRCAAMKVCAAVGTQALLHNTNEWGHGLKIPLRCYESLCRHENDLREDLSGSMVSAAT